MPDLAEIFLNAVPGALGTLGKVLANPAMLPGYVALAVVAGLSIVSSRLHKRRRG